MNKDPNKVKNTSTDQYISLFPTDIQEKLQEIRNIIKQAVPEAVEVISYNMPAFKLNDRSLAYFAAFTNHIGFYPFPSGVEEFVSLSSEYVTTKGGIQFPFDKPIPHDLVEKVIKFRVNENLKSGKGY